MNICVVNCPALVEVLDDSTQEGRTGLNPENVGEFNRTAREIERK